MLVPSSASVDVESEVRRDLYATRDALVNSLVKAMKEAGSTLTREEPSVPAANLTLNLW